MENLLLDLLFVAVMIVGYMIVQLRKDVKEIKRILEKDVVSSSTKQDDK